MAKWYGIVGYAETKETVPGVWKEVVTVKPYFGDIMRDIRTLRSSDKLNDDINISNEISIVSDAYANQNFHLIRYIEYMGTKWKVISAEVQYPRLILSLGGVYNGGQA